MQEEGRKEGKRDEEKTLFLSRTKPIVQEKRASYISVACTHPLLFNRAMYYNRLLQSRSESCAWQWGGEVIVLVVILIQEIHLLHAEEWQTLREETGKIGYTS